MAPQSAGEWGSGIAVSIVTVGAGPTPKKPSGLKPGEVPANVGAGGKPPPGPPAEIADPHTNVTPAIPEPAPRAKKPANRRA